MNDQPSEQAPDTQSHADSTPTPHTITELLWTLLLVAGISAAIGAASVMLSAHMFHPTPPVKLGVVDIQRLTRTLTAGQPNGAASLTRFDETARALVDAEPGLILLVKEAVVGANHPDDYTDAFISLLQIPTPPDHPRN